MESSKSRTRVAMRVMLPDTGRPVRAEVRTSLGHPGLDPSVDRGAGATAELLSKLVLLQPISAQPSASRSDDQEAQRSK
jgi:hypothetical protein